MKLSSFHLMPWPNIKPELLAETNSAWVTYPNSDYDPELGRQLYGEYLDQLVFADEVGFDAICVNEHHQNAYGMMPSPNIMAAALISRTKQAKIAILGNGIALRDNPLRVAEEVGMLDVMSGGRIISGFVRGIGAEYHSLNIDPTTSSTTAYTDFADLGFTSATITAYGALIYNSTPTHTYSDPTVCVLDFSGAKTSTSGTFTIIFPTDNSSSAIIRIA